MTKTEKLKAALRRELDYLAVDYFGMPYQSACHFIDTKNTLGWPEDRVQEFQTKRADYESR